MNLKAVADLLIQELKKKKFIIQRYDAYSTSSVYIKLDYGMGNSLRISDHSGKNHLSYRYNLITNLNEYSVQTTQQGYLQHFYPITELGKLIEQVVKDRKERLEKYGKKSYVKFMEKNRTEGENKKGFWQQAVMIFNPMEEVAYEENEDGFRIYHDVDISKAMAVKLANKATATDYLFCKKGAKDGWCITDKIYPVIVDEDDDRIITDEYGDFVYLEQCLRLKDVFDFYAKK